MNSNPNNSDCKVSEPKISEEDKELQRMATTVETGVRQDMVSGKKLYMCQCHIDLLGGHSSSLPGE